MPSFLRKNKTAVPMPAVRQFSFINNHSAIPYAGITQIRFRGRDYYWNPLSAGLIRLPHVFYSVCELIISLSFCPVKEKSLKKERGLQNRAPRPPLLFPAVSVSPHSPGFFIKKIPKNNCFCQYIPGRRRRIWLASHQQENMYSSKNVHAN